MDFIPPSDTEIERSILCQIIIDPTDAGEYLDALIPEDFYKASHQSIFAAMQRLSGVAETIGIVELMSDLKGSGLLEKVGGANYLSGLMDEIPPSSTDYAISALRQLAVRRKTLEICNAATKRALTSPDAKGMIDFVQSEIMNLDPDGASSSSCSTMSEEITAGLKRWHHTAKNPGSLTGVPSGMRQLDFLTCGFQKTDLIILAARPSMGKTAMSIGWAIAAAKAGKRVLYFSLEQSKSQLVTRAVAGESRLNSHKFRTGYFSPGDMDRVEQASRSLSPLPISIDDMGGVSAGEIRRKSRRANRKNRIDLVIIDHLQLIASHDRRENRNIELGDITRSLKAMAKELEIPVVVLSQLNRNLENRPDKRPRLSDLRESGNIEQDADLVAFIYRPEHHGLSAGADHFEGYTEIGLAKHRDGPVGVVISKFNQKTVRFFDVERDEVGGLFRQQQIPPPPKRTR
jgi:replicative DNA helicase